MPLLLSRVRERIHFVCVIHLYVFPRTMCELREYVVNQYASQFIFTKLYSNILMNDIQKV